MESSLCTVCRKPKATHECEMCHQAVCRKCLQRLGASTFSFLEKIPAELTHSLYCGRCYDSKVLPALAEYESMMATARQVFVFLKNKGEETRLMDRSEKPLRVEGGPDEKETLLRLAFRAALRGCNALVDVEIASKKVRHPNGYQTSSWRAAGVPTRVDAARLERDERAR